MPNEFTHMNDKKRAGLCYLFLCFDVPYQKLTPYEARETPKYFVNLWRAAQVISVEGLVNDKRRQIERRALQALAKTPTFYHRAKGVAGYVSAMKFYGNVIESGFSMPTHDYYKMMHQACTKLMPEYAAATSDHFAQIETWSNELADTAKQHGLLQP